MQKSPLLTVLIPNFNYGKHLAQAIDSVLAQDYPAVELVFVDDGSTDDSVAVARRALSKPNRLERQVVMELPANRGKLGAINAALAEVCGDYLITLDADDWLAPDYVSRCVKTLEAQRLNDPSIGFVYTDCHLVNEYGAIIDRGRSVAFDRELVGRLSFLPEPALMLTRTFREAAPFDESIRVATKHHKWCRVVANGWNGYHIAEPMFYYRMHDANMSGIGRKVLGEVEQGRRGERILSGYWQLANDEGGPSDELPIPLLVPSYDT